MMNEPETTTTDTPTPRKRAGGYRPTEYFVREALRAHVDKEVTAQVIGNWIRREKSAGVRAKSVSSALARFATGAAQLDGLSVTRVSLGIYSVRLIGGDSTPTTNGALTPGDLVEVVHVDSQGRTWAADDAGRLYKIQEVTNQ